MINLNFQTDDNQINDFLVVCEKFNQRPHRLVIHDTYQGVSFEEYVQKLSIEPPQNCFIEMIPSEDDYIFNQRILKQITENIFISYLEIDKNNDDFVVSEIIFYFKSVDDSKEIENIIDDLSQFIVDFSESETHKINYLAVKESALILDPLHFEDQENIELFYNSETLTQVNKLIKKLKKSNTGISIFYGDSGLGKTQLSKYVCKSVDEICIYIPLNLIDQSINNPEFKNFLKKWGKVLLVIDDCDFLFNPMFGKNNYFAHNLLQLVDGVFTEICKIHTLLIFNAETEDEIDEYLLNANSTLDVIQITKLSTELSNELSEHLGHKKRYKTSTKLIEILKGKKSTESQKIGLS